MKLFRLFLWSVVGLGVWLAPRASVAADEAVIQAQCYERMVDKVGLAKPGLQKEGDPVAFAASELCGPGCELAILVLPDPRSAALEGLFDRGLEGAVSALTQPPAHGTDPAYILDGHWFPWSERAHPEEGSKEESNQSNEIDCASVLPGVMRFRAAERENGERGALLLIVGEMPAAGVDAKVLEAAKAMMGFPFASVQVIGPYFSRSAPDLLDALRGNADCLELATGTATVKNDRSQLCDLGPLSVFVDNRRMRRCEPLQLIDETRAYPDGSAVGSNCQGDDASARPSIALLYEGASRFGQLTNEDSGFWGIPFPPTIADLRKAYADQARAFGHAGPWLAARLDGEADRADLLPQRSRDALLGHDLGFGAIRDQLRAQHINHVALHFPVPEDVIFAAREVRREMPEARLILLVHDLLFTHPEHAVIFDGALVSTPFPNLGPLPLRESSAPDLINASTPPFSRDSVVGIYCATMHLMRAHLPQFCKGTGKPERDDRSSKGCRTCLVVPVTPEIEPLVAVLRGGRIWPLHATQGGLETAPVQLPTAWWLALFACVALYAASRGLGKTELPEEEIAARASGSAWWWKFARAWPRLHRFARFAVPNGAALTALSAGVALSMSGLGFLPVMTVVADLGLLATLGYLLREFVRILTRRQQVSPWMAGLGAFGVLALSAWLYPTRDPSLPCGVALLDRTVHLASGVSPLAPALLAALSLCLFWHTKERGASVSRRWRDFIRWQKRSPLDVLIVVFATLPVALPLIWRIHRLTLEKGLVQFCAFGGLLACYLVHIASVLQLLARLRQRQSLIPAGVFDSAMRSDFTAHGRWLCAQAIFSGFIVLVAINSYPFHPQRILEMMGSIIVLLSVAGCSIIYVMFDLRETALDAAGRLKSVGKQWLAIFAFAALPLLLATKNYFPFETYALQSWVSSYSKLNESAVTLTK